MKTLLGLGLLCSFALLSVPVAGAEERIDTSHIMIRKGIADKMTPAELQAFKERAARNLASRRGGRTAPAADPDTPADACPAATHEFGALPFGPVSDTTVGMTDDYDPEPTMAAPACAASTNCVGRPSGRGIVYLGTGVGPDRAYRIRTDADCDLTIDLSPPADDLGLLVYQATCSDDLSNCACVSDTGYPGNPAGNDEQVVLSAVAGTDYFILIDGYSSGAAPPGPAGPFDLTITGTGCNLTAPGTYHTITPCRLIDTRNTPNGPFAGPALVAGAERPFDPSAGACGIPANATALFLNVTVVSPTNNGFLQVYSTGGAAPTVSAVNYSAGQTRGNNGIFGLDGTGQFYIRCGQAAGGAHVVVDVAGYFQD